jgi:hypothetical protein
MLNAVRALRTIDKERAHELLPEHLHKYLGQERILPVAWYPEGWERCGASTTTPAHSR